MKLVGLIDEDFVNYKKTCTTLEFPYCTFKCDKECGKPVCQNSELASANIIDIDVNDIVERYMSNNISKAICCQGLEPLDSRNDLKSLLISLTEHKCTDPIVIYTGYKEEEINIPEWTDLYNNIIFKFGRFVPGQESHFDEVLGVSLASDNQYAKSYKKEQ